MEGATFLAKGNLGQRVSTGQGLKDGAGHLELKARIFSQIQNLLVFVLFLSTNVFSYQYSNNG